MATESMTITPEPSFRQRLVDLAQATECDETALIEEAVSNFGYFDRAGIQFVPGTIVKTNATRRVSDGDEETFKHDVIGLRGERRAVWVGLVGK